MPPRKSLGSSAKAASARLPKLPGIKYKPTALLSKFADSDSDSDADLGNGNHVRLSQTILGSHNSLKQLLSGPSSSQPEPTTPSVPKKRGRKPKLAVAAPESPLQESTTPISRLKNAAALLASPPDKKRSSIHFDDIEPIQVPKKRGRGRPRKVVPAPTSPELRVESPQILPKPRTKRKYTRRQNVPSKSGQNGQTYVEQVSQHEIDLEPAPEHLPKRRSSYSNRGKRVLSIGNGYVAKPHSEVSATEYYKLLDTSMPEPSQVRQLLVWCFRRKLEQENENDEDSAGSNTARGIAKIIKQELLEDLVDGAISTSWYSRRDESDESTLSSKRIVRPNPLNESNKENVEIFTRKLRQLQAEKQEWHQSFDNAVAPLLGLSVVNTDLDKQQLRKHADESGQQELANDVVDEKLLERIQTTANDVKTYVPELLEESVDRLYHMLYQMGQTVKLVSKVEQDRLQAQVAQVVQKFMGRGHDQPTRHITSKELLRGISRLDAPKPKVAR